MNLHLFCNESAFTHPEHDSDNHNTLFAPKKWWRFTFVANPTLAFWESSFFKGGIGTSNPRSPFEKGVRGIFDKKIGLTCLTSAKELFVMSNSRYGNILWRFGTRQEWHCWRIHVPSNSLSVRIKKFCKWIRQQHQECSDLTMISMLAAPARLSVRRGASGQIARSCQIG